MIAQLPASVSDGSIVLMALAAFVAVIAGLYGFAKFLLRQIDERADERIRPLSQRLDDHMSDEERLMDRIATALEIIANKVGVFIPNVRGGSDEGDDSP